MAAKLADVVESFEASFADKREIPKSLVDAWVGKAVSQYGTEIAPLEYDPETGEFAQEVGGYVIDTLATMVKVYYLQREVSRVNKIASIVGKDLSVNGTNGLQKYTKEELEEVKGSLLEMLENLKPPAYG